MNFDQEEIKKEINAVSGDIEDVKETWETKRYQGQYKTLWFIKKHQWKLVATFLAILFGIAIFGMPDIPKWLLVMLVSIGVGVTVGYYPAKKVVKWFVKDDRVPFIAIDPPQEGNDFEAHYIPREMIEDIHFHGEPTPITTKRGRGFAADKIHQTYVEGEMRIYVIGTELGSNGIEYRRQMKKEVKKNREQFKPKAKKFDEIQHRLPFVLDEVRKETANNIIQSMEGMESFNNNAGSELIKDIEKQTKSQKEKELIEELSVDENDVSNEETNGQVAVSDETISDFDLKLVQEGENNG